MRIVIDTDTGNIHMEEVHMMQDAIDALMQAGTAMIRYAQELQTQPDEGYMEVDPIAQIEALRLDLQTWYDECTKYNRPLQYDTWIHYAMKYLDGMEVLEAMEREAGVDVTDLPLPPTFADNWTEADHEYAQQAWKYA